MTTDTLFGSRAYVTPDDIARAIWRTDASPSDAPPADDLPAHVLPGDVLPDDVPRTDVEIIDGIACPIDPQGALDCDSCQ